MSNIVPQQRKGRVVWGKLENEHRLAVAGASKGIKAVWLIRRAGVPERAS